MRRILAALAALLAALPAPADTEAAEGDLKAAIVYRMTLFMHWPSRAPREPVRICVMGRDATAEALLRLPAVSDTPVAVQRLDRRDEPAGCHVLYLGAEPIEGRSLPEKHLITVTQGGAPPGVIHLDIENARVVFDVDLAQARATRVELRAQLLKLARKVSGVSP